MKTSDKVIALGFGICAIVAIALAAAAPKAAADTPTNGFKAAKFKVEVKGWQNVLMQNTHEADSKCDVSDFSSGRERLSFHTAKPIVITAFDTPGGGFNPEFFAGHQLGIPTVATVQRSFTPSITSNPDPECGENGGADPGTEVFKPDCGTRHIAKYPVNLQYGRDNQDGLLLSSGDTDGEPFERCPSPAPVEAFPWLLVEDSAGKYIYASLSQQELFDPNFQKWISIAGGSRKQATPDGWHKTTVHWEVSFTRLKEKAYGN